MRLQKYWGTVFAELLGWQLRLCLLRQFVETRPRFVGEVLRPASRWLPALLPLYLCK